MAKRGRPRAAPDRALIQRLASHLWTVKDIAAEVGLSERTLFRNFVSDLEAGRRQWRGTLRQRLMKQIANGNFFALKFLACQPEERGGFGWTDTQTLTHEHRGQVPVDVPSLQAALVAARGKPNGQDVEEATE